MLIRKMNEQLLEWVIGIDLHESFLMDMCTVDTLLVMMKYSDWTRAYMIWCKLCDNIEKIMKSFEGYC